MSPSLLSDTICFCSPLLNTSRSQELNDADSSGTGLNFVAKTEEDSGRNSSPCRQVHSHSNMCQFPCLIDRNLFKRIKPTNLLKYREEN